MRLLAGIAGLWAFVGLGQLAVGLTKLPVPGGVAAMLLLWAALETRIVRLEWLDLGARSLLAVSACCSSGGEQGVTDLARRTGLVPSTAHRLLRTLTKRGYVTHRPETGRYLLGYKLVELASAAGSACRACGPSPAGISRRSSGPPVRA